MKSNAILPIAIALVLIAIAAVVWTSNDDSSSGQAMGVLPGVASEEIRGDDPVAQSGNRVNPSANAERASAVPSRIEEDQLDIGPINLGASKDPADDSVWEDSNIRAISLGAPKDPGDDSTDDYDSNITPVTLGTPQDPDQFVGVDYTAGSSEPVVIGTPKDPNTADYLPANASTTPIVVGSAKNPDDN